MNDRPEGTHAVAPLLPEGVRLERFALDSWPDGYYIRTASGYMADYPLDPPPDAERVRADAAEWMAADDLEQLIAVLVDAEWVLA